MASFFFLCMTFLVIVSADSDSRLKAGETLPELQSLLYGIGRYELKMGYVCNLTFRDRRGIGRLIWQSDTGGKNWSCFLKMEFDGNMIIYKNNKNGGVKPVWATNTTQQNVNGEYFLEVTENITIHNEEGKSLWVNGVRVGN